jgi:hypothetical protein
LRQLGRDEESEAEYAAVAEIAARVYGAEHPLTLSSRTGRAFCLDPPSLLRRGRGRP